MRFVHHDSIIRILFNCHMWYLSDGSLYWRCIYLHRRASIRIQLKGQPVMLWACWCDRVSSEEWIHLTATALIKAWRKKQFIRKGIQGTVFVWLSKLRKSTIGCLWCILLWIWLKTLLCLIAKRNAAINLSHPVQVPLKWMGGKEALLTLHQFFQDSCHSRSYWSILL